MSSAITLTCSSCLLIYASDEAHACAITASTPTGTPAPTDERSARTYDALVDARVRALVSDWPTLDEAHACINCHAIVRTLDNARCSRCGSESTFDLALALASPRAEANASISGGGIGALELQPVIDRLDTALTEVLTEEGAIS